MLRPLNQKRIATPVSMVLCVLSIAFFVAACTVVSVRAYRAQSTPGAVVDSRFDANSAFRDFHNAIYYPVRATLTGVNPYSSEYREEFHPDELGFPFFYPSTIVLHAPFGLLEVRSAQWTFLVCNFLLVLLVVCLEMKYANVRTTMAAVFGIAAVVILSRPGVLNFFGVQLSLIHVLGCLLALEFGRSKPSLAALGLLFASCKPTFAIPLAILMLARGNWKSVIFGTGLSLIVGALGVAWIASQVGGLDVFVEQVRSTYFANNAMPEVPQVTTSWTRVDAYSILPRWNLVEPGTVLELSFLLGIVGFGAVCTFAERSRDQVEGAFGRFGILAVIGVLISVYHQPYDLMLLTIPLIALLCSNLTSDSFSPVLRWSLIALLAFPMLNFLGTYKVLGILGLDETHLGWKVIVTSNAVSLLLAYLLVGVRMFYSRVQVAESEQA